MSRHHFAGRGIFEHEMHVSGCGRMCDVAHGIFRKDPDNCSTDFFKFDLGWLILLWQLDLPEACVHWAGPVDYVQPEITELAFDREHKWFSSVRCISHVGCKRSDSKALWKCCVQL